MSLLSILAHYRSARAENGSSSATVQDDLAAQWYNPTDIATILLIIGGDVVQKAFAQGTGKLYVPVCFSFGCIAYAFMGLVNVIGDGRIMPPPDYPCKVFNLDSGYARENKSFVVGRLLRDLEAREARRLPSADGDYALKITVFEATWNGNGPTRFSWTYLHLVGVFITSVQLAISSIPLALKGDWSVFLITAVGTVFVQWCGCLPQWTSEKLPSGQQSDSIYALTSGNGARDIMVILGYGHCLNLESLAAPHPPRNSRPWEKFSWLSRPRPDGVDDGSPFKYRQRQGEGQQREAIVWNVWPFHGVPLGFALTRITYTVLSVLWLCLLINVAAPRQFPDSWCFLAVGCLGMFQNAWLAAKELRPAMRNLPLKKVDQFLARKVMDGLMDFHTTFGRGIPLLEEFFPGPLIEAEAKWWANNDFDEYETQRVESGYRGTPRRRQPNKYRKFSLKELPKRRATLAEMKLEASSRAQSSAGGGPNSTPRAHETSKGDLAMTGTWHHLRQHINEETTKEKNELGGPSSFASSSRAKMMSGSVQSNVPISTTVFL